MDIIQSNDTYLLSNFHIVMVDAEFTIPFMRGRYCTSFVKHTSFNCVVEEFVAESDPSI
jgi:hypothetical protein